MVNSVRMALFIAVFAVLSAVSIPLAGCSHAKESERERDKNSQVRERDGDDDEHEEEEDEEFEHSPPPKPMEWGGGIVVEPVEGATDTVRFHIGSPLFLRLKITADRACEPFSGQPFFFDALGAQLGWGFEEVADSIIFPHAKGACDRIVMLSSESSNRIAEGTYTFKTLIYIDAASRLYSDTIVVHAERSDGGANALSYSRFLQELIVRNSALLNDPETIRALFANTTPRSAESEVYRAAILLRGGDLTGAQGALASARQIAESRRNPLDRNASAAYDAVSRALAKGSSR
jgi:hypothetical protein